MSQIYFGWNNLSINKITIIIKLHLYFALELIDLFCYIFNVLRNESDDCPFDIFHSIFQDTSVLIKY